METPACTKEPSQLRRGKAFHKLIQAEWEEEAEGDVRAERHVIKPNGRRGRVDVFVNDDDPKSPVAVIEVKATDWDKIKAENIRRNVRRQSLQILCYIESQIIGGKYVVGGEGKDVSPGIIFPRRPQDRQRMKQIEELFMEDGIPVVWHDETLEERKARNQE